MLVTDTQRTRYGQLRGFAGFYSPCEVPRAAEVKLKTAEFTQLVKACL
ncbi:hypothetical protein [Halomonas korlensis]|uniref:Uncharacterized protein n=1 Tax=Halomonas korlensis TaxID=463301 RepID=A0A1I7G4P2_9GAMM|nr:hypothetical protein [Halomonas korlensis]SFU43435.1 hypothetical protein SAMN04487955_102249 [Halomonas korlensis]